MQLGECIATKDKSCQKVDNLDILDRKCIIEHEPILRIAQQAFGNKFMDVILVICVILHHSPHQKCVNNTKGVNICAMKVID